LNSTNLFTKFREIFQGYEILLSSNQGIMYLEGKRGGGRNGKEREICVKRGRKEMKE